MPAAPLLILCVLGGWTDCREAWLAERPDAASCWAALEAARVGAGRRGEWVARGHCVVGRRPEQRVAEVGR